MRLRALALAALILVAGSARGVSWDDLLTPDQAFPMSLAREDAGRVRIAFEIADGYALYRNKLKVVGVVGFEVSSVELPAGERVVDPVLGELELYRGRVEFTVIGTAAPNAPIELDVTSQGCADVGVCFNPTVRRVSAT